MRIHGYASKNKTPEYKIWLGIKKRCFNKKAQNYKYYGGRGITMHEPWIGSFELFFRWVGKRPSPKHSIERVENELGYEPGNVCWALRTTQARNRRNNRPLSIGGVVMLCSQWAKVLGVTPATITMRLKAGWPVEKILAPKYSRNPSSTKGR